MFQWALGGLGSLFGFVGDAVGSVAGWAWDKVTTGIYTWLAYGLALLIEWVWSILDSATTPRLTASWFRNDLAAQVGLLALAVTVAMMLASAMQAALAGRPEQIGDAVKEGVRAIVASAMTITVLDVLIGVVDEASAMVWQVGRPDLVQMLEGIVLVATTSGPLATTFVGPLCLLIGFLGLIGLVVSLMMRSALIYVAAALAPLVWSANVLPTFRGSARKLIHLTVALVLSKLAIVITLVVAVKLIAHPAGDPDSSSIVNDGAAAVGVLMAGFVCFLIAAVTPLVLYKLMPTVEAAAIGAGVAGGWGRSATTAAHTGLMVKSLGASGAASAATRTVPGQAGVQGNMPRGGIAGLTGHQPDPTSAPGGASSGSRGPSGQGGPGQRTAGTAAAARPRPGAQTSPVARTSSRRRPTEDDQPDPTPNEGPP
jgi:type IV secretion system protein TrbL